MARRDDHQLQDSRRASVLPLSNACRVPRGRPIRRAVHGSDPVTGHLYGEERVEIADGTVVWWCPGAGHAVAPVGQLTAEVARTL